MRFINSVKFKVEATKQVLCSLSQVRRESRKIVNIPPKLLQSGLAGSRNAYAMFNLIWASKSGHRRFIWLKPQVRKLETWLVWKASAAAKENHRQNRGMEKRHPRQGSNLRPSA